MARSRRGRAFALSTLSPGLVWRPDLHRHLPRPSVAPLGNVTTGSKAGASFLDDAMASTMSCARFGATHPLLASPILTSSHNRWLACSRGHYWDTAAFRR